MHIFTKDIAIEQKDKNIFGIDISENWSINNVPNGGYLIALLSQALLSGTEKTSTPLITASFISRCKPGPGEIKIRKTGNSKRTDRFHASLFQDGKERIMALGTFFEGNGNEYKRYEKGPPVFPSREDSVPVPEIPNYSLYSNTAVYVDPSTAGWMKGEELADVSANRGWIRFKEPRKHDIASIALFADAFAPPALVTHGPVAWVPTIEFTLNIRSMPVTEWCKAEFRTRFISGGICEEDGEIWDEEGNLVALSRQIALFDKGREV